ncbi:uncharacterized protein SPAPADRAFT_52382 [Spathaspora passalidarum NRRL Y-27907]|uniref:Uncharacterized protein n=1 Tax=Spathaspora passalidarum (strain NRRL Y-27907 / 11-Y1) TaxID=619300 RepID=G3ATQ6_SPAPN|nr:uncharacterized protein SPAPADRAFT_52382 [Spathaspora passalidarum NRRL Y-27907]EGW30282.1 hypothetical protein SPAPADRAFT_52382 [Spathaspora passalidarum NRRL Y-27907]
MNMDKENAVSNALKQLSINKQKSPTLDDHLDLIHTTQEEIQAQLHNIEVQSTQTSVDLAQLFDRSKNNNQNLNRLLENVVAYSKEVMTEGNATKADMNRIFDKLEQLETVGKEETGEVANMVKGLLEALNKQYKEVGGNTVREVKEFHSGLKQSFQCEVGDIGASLSGIKDISEELKSGIKKNKDTLDSLTEKIPNVEHISDPIVREIKSLNSNSEATLQKILDRIAQLEKPQNYQEQFNLILSKLSKFEETRAEQDNKRQIELTNKQQELESKISHLENKYSTLCNSYTQKFHEYQQLNEKYTTLVKQIETLDVPTDMTRLKKVRQFHSSTPTTNFSAKQKRIASTPVPRSADSDFINNSDEGF